MVFGRHINRYYLKYGFFMLLGILMLLVEDNAMLEIPRVYQMVINGINDGVVTENGITRTFDMAFLLDRVCMPTVKAILLIVFTRFVWRFLFFGPAIKTERDLRNRMFHRARELSCAYYGRNKIGNLMSLFTNDLDTVQECFGWGFVMLMDALIMGSMAVLRMWGMDRVLTGLALIPLGMLMVAATILGRYMMKKWDVRQAAFSRLSDFSQESFSGVAVIKAFVKEANELMAFKKLNQENEKANVDHTKAAVLMRLLVTFFVESVTCIVLGYGGWLVYNGRFNAGQLVEFIGYFVSAVWPVMALSELIDMTSRGKASLNRIGQLLDAQPDVVDRPDAVPIEDLRGDIEFRNLTFRYPDSGQDSLKEVSFTIKAGENVGLVGKTGAGKTTLVDLLLRTYNVPDGTVFIDGQDVNGLQIRSVRAGCAYVPQDNFLFSDTIANNIAFGTDAPEGAVQEAAVLADVDANIRDFREGYETILGERGVTVSGGQKQRISIARALMKDAPILILDDSVSAVDTKTEQTILENLQKTRAGKTTILIAHRISTVEKMDKILFLDNGTLLAVGKHEVLYETCPDYRKMVDLQKLEEETQESRMQRV